MRKLLIVILCLIAQINPLLSQKILDSWKVGVGLAPSLNLNSLGFQHLSTLRNDFVTLVGFDGYGIGPYFTAFYEYKSGSWWGSELRLSYDDRGGLIYDQREKSEAEFDVFLSYLNIEPSIKYYFPDKKLSIYGGFQFLFGLQSYFSFKEDKNKDYLNKNSSIPDISSFVFGLNGGISYDFRLNNLNQSMNYIVTPFAEVSWIFNQRESTLNGINQNSINDVWSTTSFRVGTKFALEFPNYSPEEKVSNIENFDVYLPEAGNFKVRKVEEYFPIIPNVFFDKNSNEIPFRYSRIDKLTADLFNESSFIEDSKNGKIKLPNYSSDQQRAYYNILNIFGDRLRKNPNVSVKLIGSDPFGSDGLALANVIKQYLMNNFGIRDNQIFTEGRDLPLVPSGSLYTSAEEKPSVDLENRRVEFIFQEFKLHEPVLLNYFSESQIDNDLEFRIDDTYDVKSWSVSFINNQRTQTFGPFEESYMRIDPYNLMKGINESDFKVQVILVRKDNTTLTQEKSIKLKKVTLPESKKNVRFTLTFDYGRKDALKNYEDVVKNNLINYADITKYVYFHGHTDNIGDNHNNYSLSFNRADETKNLFLQKKPELKLLLHSHGFGEYNMHTYFDNSTPEGRFYNRNVVIDILPIVK